MKPQSSEHKMELDMNLVLIVTDRKNGLTYFFCSNLKVSCFCVENTVGVDIVSNCNGKYSILSITYLPVFKNLIFISLLDNSCIN